MYKQLALLFFLMATGFLCKRLKIIDDSMLKGLNRFIISVAYPCLILNRTSLLEMEGGIFANFLLSFALCLGLLMLFAAYGFIYAKRRGFPADDAPVVEFSIISPNNGFLGFPVAVAFFGDIGLLYMIACNLALNTMFFSYGIGLMRRGLGMEKRPLRARLASIALLVINPKISATIVGVLICYFDIELPDLLSSYLSAVGTIATPMAMVFIGSTLADSSFGKLIRNGLVLETALNKLIAAPIIAFLVVGFLPISPLVKSILIVSNALPVATTVPMLSELYDRNKGLASEALLLSTLFAIGTIPCAIWLTGLAI
ncbi:MAG: AEC family transporter [Clostridiales Family XIII bacterium]|jgi:predicted permease|nr:AEC family transporter [Clostridiales Family XIII bacterium]